MPRAVPGDPLTGHIPKTQLVVWTDTRGGAYLRRSPDRQWPVVPEPMAVTIRQMEPGKVAYVRTRWGIRQWRIRTINRSTWRRNNGRHYFTGMDRHGRCHSAWVDRVVSVQSMQMALTAGKQIKAIGAGR